MKLNFCTLFNSNYLSRGVVMYESLLKHCADFHLYVFAFDDTCYKFLKSQDYKHLTVVSLKDFEDDELLRVKATRTMAEYCWTCTSSTILYCIKKFSLDNCTYLDADLQFFSDPQLLFDEMGDKSVLITEHRYTREYDQSKESGKYCVQFVSFKNDEQGMNVLNWWRNACIEWCYARVENGKFGDQKYLDDWTTHFEGVHELQHLGGGIAPWNVQQYSFEQMQKKITGTEIISGKKFDVVFFHFHGVKFYNKNIVSLSGPLYALNEEVKTIFYKPYIQQLNQAKKLINTIDNSFDPNGSTGEAPMKPMNLLPIIKYYLIDLKKSIKNIFGQNLKNRIAHHYYYKNEDFNS
jgi:hypothetical protein